jgi:hypothetical protein
VIVRALLLVLIVACGGKKDETGETGSGSSSAQVAEAFDKKCVGGDVEACRNLAVLYTEGVGVTKDLKRAAALFAQACSGNSLAACNHMGLVFAEGMGVEKNPVEAAKMFARACDGGHGLACKNLGLMLRDGRGVEKDLELAEQALDKACKAEIPFACTNAGDLDRVIASGAKDDAARNAAFAKMREHYQKGCDTTLPAKAIDVTACRQLGIAYLEGTGVPKTAGAAAVWLAKACSPVASDGDDPIACRLLGMMKVDGVGLPRDPEGGVRALTRACDKKDKQACDGLALVKAGSATGSGSGSGR